jgi:hypothetical protein
MNTDLENANCREVLGRWQKDNGAQVPFIKNEKCEVMAMMRHMAGLPDSEGKKLKNE